MKIRSRRREGCKRESERDRRGEERRRGDNKEN